MKRFSIIIFLLLNISIAGAIEIGGSLNKKFEKLYNKEAYSEGIAIINKIESPTTIAYKKAGKYKDSKELYMWKLIFLHKTKANKDAILREYFYYRSIDGEINSDILKDIESNCLELYLNNFSKNFYDLKPNNIEIYEKNISNVFQYNLDSIKDKKYIEYKKLLAIKNNMEYYKKIDTFNIPTNLEQSYNSVYNYVLNFKYKGNDIEKISLALTTPFKTDSLKIFSIITFICRNVDYDYRLKAKIQFSSKIGWGTCSPSEVILYGMTVCSGYSELFKALCEYSNIKAGIIISENHAYNWVYLNDKYHILDVTWMDCLLDHKGGFGTTTIANAIAIKKSLELSYQKKYDFLMEVKLKNEFLFNATIKESLNKENIDIYFTQLYSHNRAVRGDDDLDRLFKEGQDVVGLPIEAIIILYNKYYPNENAIDYLFIEEHYPQKVKDNTIEAVFGIKRLPTEKEKALLNVSNNKNITLLELGIL